MKRLRYPGNIVILLILWAMAIYLLFDVITTNDSMELRHYLGIAALLLLTVTLFFSRNLFVLATGIVLIAGNFCGLSLVPEITTTAFHIGIHSTQIPVYWGQGDYTLLLIAHLIISRGFYNGILSPAYWNEFLSRTGDIELRFPEDKKTK
ncbi:MAG: hypothetical protein ACJ77K_01305 [Bacteroidia bacterium]